MSEIQNYYIDYEKTNRILSKIKAFTIIKNYFAFSNIQYYCDSKKNGHFQVYFSLSKTNFKIKQSITVTFYGYYCKTTIHCGVDIDNIWEIAAAECMIKEFNSKITLETFELDYETGELNLYNYYQPDESFFNVSNKYFYNGINNLLEIPRQIIDEKFKEELEEFFYDCF